MAQRSKAPRPTFKPRVRRLGPGRYLVESRSTPGVGHQVDVTRNVCSCPAGKRGLPTCWHRTLAATLDTAYTTWMTQGGRHARQERAAARPAGMAALQEAFA